VHGPEAVYSGEAELAISFLSALGSVRAAAAGTMCRTAIIDRDLEKTIDIGRCDLPSRTLAGLACAVPVIVNNGKNLDSGLAFGEIVAGRVKKTTVQAERLSEKDGAIVLWELEENERALEVARTMAEHFHLPLSCRKPAVGPDDDMAHSIQCACPGEPLFVNGVFVGTVSSASVKIHSSDGRITRIEGVRTKETGLARIAGLDIREARFKSGHIRKKAAMPCLCPVRNISGKMAVIDHNAFRSLDTIDEDTACALTVGDDTTEISGDVLARRGVRIIGITDGDRDGVLYDAMKACGSVIFRVSGITDDEAGAAIAGKIEGTDTFEGFLKKVKGMLGQMNISYEVCR
jgi:hypothetical protein